MGILSALLPLLPGLIRGAESLLKKKAKPGSDRMDLIVQQLRAAIEKLISTGEPLPDGTVVTKDTPITDDLLRGAIEAEFQRLKAAGQLAPPPPAGGLYLVQGAITPLEKRVS